jgi:hypothetical protein
MRTEEIDTPAVAATADARGSRPNRGRCSDEPSRQQTIAGRGVAPDPAPLHRLAER